MQRLHHLLIRPSLSPEPSCFVFAPEARQSAVMRYRLSRTRSLPMELLKLLAAGIAGFGATPVKLARPDHVRALNYKTG